MSPISYATKMKPPVPTKAQKDAELKPVGWVEEPTEVEIKTKELEALKAKEAVRPLINVTVSTKKLTKAEEADAAKLADLSVLPSDIPVPPAKPVIVERKSRPKKF